ncbi:MAG TPA: hypothetical protein VD838_21930 [Anaeromyxobacteraceae bacterium]|nr:hypothetical protein [Anaeromyxobacteraceae bacterium]
MTAPRQILPGTTYLITRRCFQRFLLLRPSPMTTAIFHYALAVAAARTAVLVHAFCVLSNHLHLVVTDPDARLPEFERQLNSLVARAMNVHLGRSETFWAPASYSAVALLTPDDIVNKVAYVLANPVAAGLVPEARAWPGAWSAPELLGDGRIEAPRPEIFFRRNGRMPPSAELALTVPPGFESVAAFRASVVAALEALERAARVDENGRPRTFLGVPRILAQSPFSTPRSVEPRGGLKPRIASHDRWKRVEALARLATFVDAYRRAFAVRRSGGVAIFPAGTYWMRVAHGAACFAPS